MPSDYSIELIKMFDNLRIYLIHFCKGCPTFIFISSPYRDVLCSSDGTHQRLDYGLAVFTQHEDCLSSNCYAY